MALVAVMAASADDVVASTGSAPRPRPRQELPATASRAEANNSPALAADPTEPRFVALANRLDGPDFDCALQLSGDGGRTFVPRNAVPEERLPKGAEKCYSPEVAFDREGRLYYLFAGLHGLGNAPMGVFLTTTDDRGRTFSTPHRVLGPNAFQARMVIDDGIGERGRLHVVWLAASGDPALGSLPPPPNPIMAMHSDDGGRTFSEPVQVSDPQRQRVVAPAVALGEGGEVHVLYYDLGRDAVDYQGLEGPTWEGTWALVLATSKDQGKRFDRGVVVDAQVVPPARVILIFTMAPPALVADASGTLLAAWRDARSGDPDIWLRRSSDGGRRWEKARRVNDDAVANGADQDLPRLAVAPGGRIDAIFFDRRDDPDNRRYHLYYTFSTDSGRSFAPNLRITARASDSRIGQRYSLLPAAKGLVELGSRNALLSEDDRVTAAWTDTRYANDPMQQDIMATIIDLPASGGTGGSLGPVELAGIAVAILALVLVVVVARRRRRRRSVPGTAGEDGPA